MKYETIDDIYAGNEKVRLRLKNLIADLPDEKARLLPAGEKWSVEQIVEHIAIVDESTIKICSKLLRKAQEAGQASNGRTATITDNFQQRSTEIAAIKIEAPSFVQPTGEPTIAESLVRLDANAERLNEMKPMFEAVDGTQFKFPHPFFGDISAHEWLALKGGHEMRHLKQIERLLERI